MAKKTTSSKATATENEASVTSQQDTATLVQVAVSDPSGENGPDGINASEDSATASTEGTHNPASESGDAAGEASADPVKPQDNTEPTEAVVAEAESSTSDPEVEASASGTSSDASQADAAGDAGANAGVSAGITAGEANAILSKILGVTIAERRKFLVWARVRHDNVLYERGSAITVDATAHAELAAAKKVSPRWDAGQTVEG